jgi:hypothetical protein
MVWISITTASSGFASRSMAPDRAALPEPVRADGRRNLRQPDDDAALQD